MSGPAQISAPLAIYARQQFLFALTVKADRECPLYARDLFDSAQYRAAEMTIVQNNVLVWPWIRVK